MAFSRLSAADAESPLCGEDLEGLSMAAHLSGKEAKNLELLARAHQSFLNEGATRRAARCAFWLGMISMNSGEMAQGSGWLARCGRLLESEDECVEHGYLLMAAGARAVRQGQAEGNAAFVKAAALGKRFGDKDLVTMALHGQGRALIRFGEISKGVRLLDEAMAGVMAGEVTPIVAGVVYCSVLESCRETFDLQRAQEWTAALTRWCESQPELVPFRGHCQLQRAELLQLRGDWRDALAEVEQAQEKLSDPPPKPALGAALYRAAEIHRLLGSFPEAEEAYRLAHQRGYTVQPGLALLRLAQGKRDAAQSAIRPMADESAGSSSRPEVLDAFVEIALAAKDVAAARAAADELAKISERHGAPLLKAMAACATGAVLLAERDAPAALVELRRGWKRWCELQAPYEEARARVLIGLAYREQGHGEAADQEIAAARKVLVQLGAATEVARLEKLAAKKLDDKAGPLTARELEVLRLVACGTTNRGIAGKLSISEKTVARHISNIFVKLDLNSRAAATAYAYQHGLA